SAASMTLRRVSGDTLAPRVNVRETAERETPACLATSSALMNFFSDIQAPLTGPMWLALQMCASHQLPGKIIASTLKETQSQVKNAMAVGPTGTYAAKNCSNRHRQ